MVFLIGNCFSSFVRALAIERPFYLSGKSFMSFRSYFLAKELVFVLNKFWFSQAPGRTSVLLGAFFLSSSLS